MDDIIVEETDMVDPEDTVICTDCSQTVLIDDAILVPEPTQNDATRWVCSTCYLLNHQETSE